MRKLFCPVSGLQLYTQDNWRQQRFGKNFTANFYIIGQSILYSGPSGAADLESAVSVLKLSGEVARHVAGGAQNYIQIEDYASFNNATIDARKHFIEQMISRDRVQSVIFCNLSPMMNLFVKIGQRFNTSGRSVYAVRNYREAIDKAVRLCHKHDLDTGAFIFGNQTVYRQDSPTLVAAELLSESHWDILTDGFTNRIGVIDQHILHSTISGFFQESHVPLMNDMRPNVQETFASGASFDYIIVDASELKGATRKARQLYMKSLKEWHERFPLRMYITVGASVFMATAVRLAKAIIPFRAVVAKNIDHAFELIRADKKTKDLKSKKPKAGKVDPIQGYVEDLLAYIGGIEWEREGLDDSAAITDRSHPFYIVFQAIKLIKDELDDSFATQEKIQDQLKQKHKMQAIGTLTGGIAHEFNNILGIIIGNTELAINTLPDANRTQACLTEIRSASLRARDAVGHLLTFAHKSPVGCEAMHISPVIRDAIKIMQAAASRSIEIHLDIKYESAIIMADPADINQVIMNICNNSIHAIGENQGIIDVCLDCIQLEASSASQYKDLKPGKFAKLTVEDDGHGIDQVIMERIFDPYFTTREVDQGLGMGLAIVYGIVNQLDGAIKVKSSVGKGTVVEILLPVIQERQGIEELKKIEV
jgi:signal transduction histidine kinase